MLKILHCSKDFFRTAFFWRVHKLFVPLLGLQSLQHQQQAESVLSGDNLPPQPGQVSDGLWFHRLSVRLTFFILNKWAIKVGRKHLNFRVVVEDADQIRMQPGARSVYTCIDNPKPAPAPLPL